MSFSGPPLSPVFCGESEQITTVTAVPDGRQIALGPSKLHISFVLNYTSLNGIPGVVAIVLVL